MAVAGAGEELSEPQASRVSNRPEHLHPCIQTKMHQPKASTTHNHHSGTPHLGSPVPLAAGHRGGAEAPPPAQAPPPRSPQCRWW